MLLNPSKQPTKRRGASPAQLRALAAGRRRRAVAANPPPRKRRRHALRVATHHSARRIRRNPIGTGGITGQMTDVAFGAAGALATNAITALLPLPSTMMVGWQKEAVKSAVTIGLGMVGKKVLGRRAGKMVEGALVVSAYNLMGGMLPPSLGGTALPALGGAQTNTLKGLSYMSPGYNAGGNLSDFNETVSPLGQYVSGAMGEYVY
jgi:hypothetical protein